ncbi:hypothetical protein KGM48_03830 [Patescibacteria group bacterium]|nr:hypothetical protein [Patescibacteria group bacterium]
MSNQTPSVQPSPGTGGDGVVQPGPGSGPSTGVGGESISLINPLGGPSGPGSLMDFLNKILDFVIQIGSVVVILMLIYVGFLFVVARGDSTKISTARSALLWTLVGALILLGSKAISLGIQATVQAISAGQ